MDALPDFLTGDDLERALSTKIIHEPLVEGLLYKDSSLLISSEPGVGKSLLSIQAMMQMSCGSPVFGFLAVPRPIKCWYIQMERSIEEPLERIQELSTYIPFDKNNIIIDTSFQSMNFLNPAHLAKVIERGLTLKADLMKIDPLYGIATGLSKDEVGSSVAKILTTIKKSLAISLWINHHTVKDQFQDGKKVERNDPFYGAQWLKAHMTGSYLLRSTADGVEFINKKDSHGNLLKKLSLIYDPMTYVSTVNQSGLNLSDRLKLYCNTIYNSGNKLIEINLIASELVTDNHSLRRLFALPPFKDIIKRVSPMGSKGLYRITDSLK